MNPYDPSFLPAAGLDYAVHLLNDCSLSPAALPVELPEQGIGETAAIKLLAPSVLGKSARLDSSTALAHMDPPTPWITWAMALWNASLNQNLLHPATAPFALTAEQLVIDWLTPYFGMTGGHFCAGSTLANLTALWAARNSRGVKKVIASAASHLSIKKSADILGLEFIQLAVDKQQKIILPESTALADACLVLTAGTTATGSIDNLTLAGQAAWTHVDAAWAGALCLTDSHSALLNGIELADSVAVSAHKWLFQPKDSAIVMFQELDQANAAISFGGGYLASPNVGVQGSRGAAAIPLLATLLAWGKTGLAQRIEHCMQLADRLAKAISSNPDLELWAMPVAGVNVFRHKQIDTLKLAEKLPAGMFSICQIDQQYWLRSVAANPLAEVEQIYQILLDSITDLSPHHRNT